MLVKRLKILPIESIVRGYITGSGWAEYKKSGTVWYPKSLFCSLWRPCI